MFNNDDIMSKLEVLVAQNELLEAKIEKSHIYAEGLNHKNELLINALEKLTMRLNKLEMERERNGK